MGDLYRVIGVCIDETIEANNKDAEKQGMEPVKIG